VDFLGRNIASLGLHQFRRVSDTDRERLTDTDLIRLINQPNPSTTKYRLLDALVHDMGIYDRAYWLKARTKKGQPFLLRLPPAYVRPIGTWMWADAFEFNGGRERKIYPADQVVHFRGYSPDGDASGASPIESLRRVLAEEYEAGRMRENTLRNGARVSGYLERPAGAPAWSDTAADRFRRSWQAQYAGSGPMAGGTPILEDGMKFVAASQTAEQLQYVEARKLTREEVAAAYFIPPTMVGVMDSATFSNIKEQHKHLYQDTLGPWLQMIAEELALQLLGDFPDSQGTYLEFNLAEKLRGSFEEQAAQLQASVGGPFMTRNEARALSNLPAIDGGDELIVPMNVTEGGQASPQDSAPDGLMAGGDRLALKGGAPVPRLKAGPDLTDEQKAGAMALFEGFFERQRKTVVSAIAAGGEWWDAERWNAELAADLEAFALSLTTEVGRAQALALGFDAADYDVERTLEFLASVAASRAEMVNTSTERTLRAELEAAEEELEEEEDADRARAYAAGAVFDNAVAQRAGAAGSAFAVNLASFASVEAGEKLAGDSLVKTWRVTSNNPRTAHVRMNGETVPIGEKFSNGMNWPGDPRGGPDEVAGCECSVDVSYAEDN
jgi:HK97 family phage portal protein